MELLCHYQRKSPFIIPRAILSEFTSDTPNISSELKDRKEYGILVQIFNFKVSIVKNHYGQQTNFKLRHHQKCNILNAIKIQAFINIQAHNFYNYTTYH